MAEDRNTGGVTEQHLHALLTRLCDALEIALPEGEPVRAAIAAAPSGDLSDRIVAAADGVGLRVRRAPLTVFEGVALARPDLPLIAVAGRGSRRRIVVVEGVFLGQARVWTVGDPVGPRWTARGTWASLLGVASGEEVVDWLLVEPAFPAGAFAAEPGASPARRLTGLLRAERRDIGVILLFAVATGVLALATPLAIQMLITWVAFGALLQPVVVLAAFLFVSLGLAAVLRALQRHAVEIVQRRVFVRLVRDVAARLSGVRMGVFDRSWGPELVNRFFDVLTVQKAAAVLLVDGASAALQAVVGLLLLAVYHPVLLVFDIVLVAALALVLGPLGRGATRTAIVESKRKYEAAAWIEEIARHPTTIKLGGTALAEARSDAVARAYLADRSRHFRVFFRQYVGMLLVQVLVGSALLLVCGWLVLEGQLTVGQLVAAEFIVASVLTGFGKIVDKLDTWYDLHAAVDKLGALADLPQDRRTGLVPTPRTEPASVHLRGVHLGPLQGVDLAVAAGSRVLVRVPSEVREILADVLVGLREPTSGAVVRDGRDLRIVRPAAAHQEVALVRGREPLIATVRDNVALARPGVDDGVVWGALARVGLADRVAALPDGLATSLGPAGRPLCPDDVARLLVARALAGSPRLVVVDGVFDGVSPATRDQLLAALEGTVVVLTVTGLPSGGFDGVVEPIRRAA